MLKVKWFTDFQKDAKKKNYFFDLIIWAIQQALQYWSTPSGGGGVHPLHEYVPVKKIILILLYVIRCYLGILGLKARHDAPFCPFSHIDSKNVTSRPHSESKLRLLVPWFRNATSWLLSKPLTSGCFGYSDVTTSKLFSTSKKSRMHLKILLLAHFWNFF